MTTAGARRRRDREIIVLLVLILTVVAVSLFRQFDINSTLRNQVDAIHASQVRACQASLQPGGVRYIVAQQLRTQIRQSQSIDYSKFFPNIPPAELKALIDQGNQQARTEIEQLLNINCQEQYRT